MVESGHAPAEPPTPPRRRRAWSAPRPGSSGRSGWTTPSAGWSSTAAGRWWCSPAPAPARRRRSSRPSRPGRAGQLRPEHVLVLTFSRRAADELRTRLSARLRRTVRGRLAWTFHSWCFALVRSFAPEFAGGAPRLLSGPEQDVDGPGAVAGPRRRTAGGARLAGGAQAAAPLPRVRRRGPRPDGPLPGTGSRPEALDRLGEMSGPPRLARRRELLRRVPAGHAASRGRWTTPAWCAGARTCSPPRDARRRAA